MAIEQAQTEESLINFIHVACSTRALFARLRSHSFSTCTCASDLAIFALHILPSWSVRTHHFPIYLSLRLSSASSYRCIAHQPSEQTLTKLFCFALPSFSSIVFFLFSFAFVTWTEIDVNRSLAFQFRVRSYDKRFVCQRCSTGCDTCVDASPCLSPYNWAFRISLLTISILCILLIFVLTFCIYKHRKIKVFKVASPVFLSLTLLGCAIMYAEVSIFNTFRFLLFRVFNRKFLIKIRFQSHYASFLVARLDLKINSQKSAKNNVNLVKSV